MMIRNIIAFCLVCYLSAATAQAASDPIDTEAIITWQAETSVPASYHGKALPNQTSPITFSVAVLEDGALINPANYPIRWYVDTVFLASGSGLQTIRIPTERLPKTRTQVRVEILREAPLSKITKSITVQRTKPSILFSTPAKSSLRASAISIQALPYFFTGTQQPNFSWRVDGQIRSVVRDLLTLDTSKAEAEQAVLVEAFGANPDNPFEIGSGELLIRIP